MKKFNINGISSRNCTLLGFVLVSCAVAVTGCNTNSNPASAVKEVEIADADVDYFKDPILVCAEENVPNDKTPVAFALVEVNGKSVAALSGIKMANKIKPSDTMLGECTRLAMIPRVDRLIVECIFPIDKENTQDTLIITTNIDPANRSNYFAKLSIGSYDRKDLGKYPCKKKE